MSEEKTTRTNEIEKVCEEYEWVMVRVRKDTHSKLDSARIKLMALISANPQWKPELVGTRLSLSDTIQYLIDEYKRLMVQVAVLARKGSKR